MSDAEKHEERLERVRRVSKVVGILEGCSDAAEFSPPCFVDCYCWHKAERLVNAAQAPE